MNERDGGEDSGINYVPLRRLRVPWLHIYLVIFTRVCNRCHTRTYLHIPADVGKDVFQVGAYTHVAHVRHLIMQQMHIMYMPKAL